MLVETLQHFCYSRPKTWFILAFIISSIILFFLWIHLGTYYLNSVAFTTKLFLDLLGYQTTLLYTPTPHFIYKDVVVGLEGTDLVNFNIVPFLALIFATPYISRRRITQAIICGVPLLFLFHVGDLLAHFPYYDGYSYARVLISIAALMRMALPFLLWFIFCYTLMIPALLSIKTRYPCPLCHVQKSDILAHIESVHQTLNSHDRKKVKQFLNKYPFLKKHG